MKAFKNDLSSYRDRRMVILGPHASVYDAARALEANHIGCVLVASTDRVLGILTDRDLAVRIIGYELEASELCVRDIMTPNVATVPVTASEADAARLMLERHVRRIPVEDGGRVVGMVTLDDLVLGGFDPNTLSEIVRAQLADPTPLKDGGSVHPTTPTRDRADAPSAERRAQRRHAAHAQASYDSLIRRVIEETGLESRPDAEAALDVVLSGLIQRLTPNEAADMLAQLPSTLRERLRGVSIGPDRSVTRESLEQALSVRLGMDPSRAIVLLAIIGRVLESAISRGELADVRAQLPADMRSIFF
jgi:CBS domain-containing protein/uncharacterized protein (DUF2267 family)